MRKKSLPIIALALVLAVPGFGQDAKGTLSMSLDECIVKALKDNLGVAIQILGPEISSEGVNRAQEKYIPTLSLSARSSKHRERLLFLPRRQRKPGRQDAELHLPQRQPDPADRRHVQPRLHGLQDDDQPDRQDDQPALRDDA